MFDKVTEENYLLLAMKHYDNVSCLTLNDFQKDLNRTKYLKRLFNRFYKKGDLKERLILNHLIIFTNVFGPEFGVKMLFFRIDKKFYPFLKTFLIFMHMLPDVIYGIQENPFYTCDIPVNMNIANILRKI